MQQSNTNIFQLIASAEDYNIRIFQGNQIIDEHIETEVVTYLTVLPENRFAYAVSNGTVGVYEKDIRLWRIKVSNISCIFYSIIV